MMNFNKHLEIEMELLFELLENSTDEKQQDSIIKMLASLIKSY